MNVRIVIACLLALALIGPAWARTPAEPPLLQISPPPVPISGSADRADTLFLFASEGPGAYGMPGTTERGYSFDGPYGEPQEAGWFGVDRWSQGGYWWHVAGTEICTGTNTDMSQALPFDFPNDPTNDFALWCGREEVCGWSHNPGYGNGWDQWVRVDLPESEVVELVFDYASDFEGEEWDYFQVFLEVNGVIEEMFLDNTEGPTGFLHHSLQFDGDGDMLEDLIFSFSSDGAWSDEDGLYVSDVGAVWLDNIIVWCDGDETFRCDFEDGQLPFELSLESPATAGIFAHLYQGNDLYQLDPCFHNNSHSWAFFDPGTSSHEYGNLPIVFDGPPYVDNAIESPGLVVDQYGLPLELDEGDQVVLQFDVYRDMPLDPLIFFNWEVAAWVEGEDCRRGFDNDNYVYYGDFKTWDTWQVDITLYLENSASGPLSTIEGIVVQLGCVDMCSYWCDSEASGEFHSPGPYFDNPQVFVIQEPRISWTYDETDAFQDNFPEYEGAGAGFVRIDRAGDFDWAEEELPVSIVDSTVVYCDLEGAGGPAMEWCESAGEERPRIYMWYRVEYGPNADVVDPASGDPLVDPQVNGAPSDGLCYSPYVGAEEWPAGSGDWWMKVQADWAHYHGFPDPLPNQYAFDLNDAWFLPGDRLVYFFEAYSAQGDHQTWPANVLNGEYDPREIYRVNCLGGDARILLVADDHDVEQHWIEALCYTGYCVNGYDWELFVTQAPGDEQSNGLASRATVEDLMNYEVIVWDAGNEGRETICAENDKTRDDLLLQAWLQECTEPSSLWVLGDNLANDLGQYHPFLTQVLGVHLVESSIYYDDRTGVHVPTVLGTHPYLQYLGGDPEFWVYGGCPVFGDFALVSPVGSLTEVLQDWEVDAGDNTVAGILNRDPDGDGTIYNDQGVETLAVFNPYSYFHVRDKGYGLPAGTSYAHVFVLHVLENLFGVSGFPILADSPDPPRDTAFTGAYPNPFNPSTTLAFYLAEAGPLKVEVFDVNGRRMATLWDGPQQAGEHELEWNGCNERGDRLASGVYFLRFAAGVVVEERKLVLLK